MIKFFYPLQSAWKWGEAENALLTGFRQMIFKNIILESGYFSDNPHSRIFSFFYKKLYL